MVWKFHGERDVIATSRGTPVQADHKTIMTEDHVGTSASHSIDDNDFHIGDDFVEDADNSDDNDTVGFDDHL